ncbi:hypothetical protein C4K37_3212 [Pseudomonas chlororaphis subsp. piscium]|nr:hypothetical protein C4K37_3212 [Pseudomonas chlororaphis subsp. piscium]AZC44147.1 hypothetical protein C4K36_3222 [Pseudomonas chlororaphis subsp. piscium]
MNAISFHLSGKNDPECSSLFDDFADFSPLLQAKNGEEKG